MGSGSSSARADSHSVNADAASSDADSSKNGWDKGKHKARGPELKGWLGSFPIGPGSSSGTARLHLAADKAVLQVQYAAQTRGIPGKDQDRYAMHVPSGGKHGLALGIFDGHSVHGVGGGRTHAASAATHLPAALMRAISKTARTVTAASGPQTSHAACVSSQRALMKEDEPLVTAVTAEFSALQSAIEQRYQKQVAVRLMAEKAKLEAEIGEEMSLDLPQEGGTTATAVVIHPRGIFAAWVGDSRAVVGLRDPAPAAGEGRVATRVVRGLPLTHDHNLGDEREQTRLLACGGKTGVGEMARTHVFVRGAEGTLRVLSAPSAHPIFHGGGCAERSASAQRAAHETLYPCRSATYASAEHTPCPNPLAQVTRSLGDSPFHREKAVSSIPDVTFHPLSPSTSFLVIASDGACCQQDGLRWIGDGARWPAGKGYG